MMKQDSELHLPDEGEIAEFGGSAQTAGEFPATETVDPEELRKQLEETRDKLLRAKAEVQNAIRRMSNEKNDALRYAHADLARSMLTVLSDLDRTLEAGAKTADVKAVLNGVKIVRDNFGKALAQHNIEPIESLGVAFDPSYHQAVMQQPSKDHPAGTVIQELEKGYKINERVLRPAKVIVSVEPQDSNRHSALE